MTLEELRQHKAQIEAIAGKYGVRNIRVFGSTVRGDARADSDVDLLVDVSATKGWDYITAKLEISDYLGKRIDFVNERALDRYIGPYILSEAVPL